ncbi:hypothetical protein L3Q82_005603 [Scortum barcoo]|uniref:Uncharacterized protein n=1 Tax=Scortum barcoo TaxID=214431 RepID=A0ACB8V655_9TELE|nr:hypothetical protein L3Q82_005603 [Scortum barcoo]
MRLRNVSFLTVLLFGLCGLVSLSWYTAFSSSRERHDQDMDPVDTVGAREHGERSFQVIKNFVLMYPGLDHVDRRIGLEVVIDHLARDSWLLRRVPGFVRGTADCSGHSASQAPAVSSATVSRAGYPRAAASPPACQAAASPPASLPSRSLGLLALLGCRSQQPACSQPRSRSHRRSLSQLAYSLHPSLPPSQRVSSLPPNRQVSSLHPTCLSLSAFSLRPSFRVFSSRAFNPCGPLPGLPSFQSLQLPSLQPAAQLPSPRLAAQPSSPQ